jgi:hypothetical protein
MAAKIIRAIETYVGKCGGDYSRWYVGIAADPLDRLLNVHGVDEEGDGCGWIIHQCAGPDEAGEVRAHLIVKGMKGATGGGESSASSVYAFRITANTRA